MEETISKQTRHFNRYITTYKSCSIILKFMGGRRHTYTHLPSLGRDDCVAMEICRLQNPAHFVDADLNLFHSSLILSCPLPPSLFSPTLLFLCLCLYILPFDAKIGFQKKYTVSDKESFLCLSVNL